MNLNPADLEKLHDLAVTAAARAGAHIQAKVGEHRETNTKDGGGDTLASQVVTEVDLESQALILELLGQSMSDYQLGLLTEESDDDSSRFEADAFWCIDPLDGTLPFIEGKPGYSVSIALVSRQGKPLIGVVRDPVAEVTCHASLGQGAFCNGESIPVALESQGQPLTWLMDRSMKDLAIYPQLAEAMQRLAEESACPDLNIVDHAGAALNGCWVAQKAPAVYFKIPKAARGGGSIWDFAASAGVMTEWGQAPTDIHGEALKLNRRGHAFMNERGVNYASSSELASSVRSIYRQWSSAASKRGGAESLE